MKTNAKDKQQIIDEFYREFLSYRPESIGVWFGAGLMAVIYGIYMWVPHEFHTIPAISALMLFFGFLGPYLYLQPYRVYREVTMGNTMPEGKNIAEILRYVPIDRADLRLYRRRKLLRFCSYTGIVYIAGQLLLSLAICHRLTGKTVVFAIFMGYILPLLANMEWLQEWLERRRR